MKDLFGGLYQTVRSPRQGWQLVVVRQFVKFAIVGVFNTATSADVYLIASRPLALDPLVANAVAFVVAVTVSFVLNKSWTFRNQERSYRRQYSMFFGVSGVGFLLSEAILFITHKLLGVHDVVAFGIAVVIVMFWNFGANRAWTFTDR